MVTPSWFRIAAAWSCALTSCVLFFTPRVAAAYPWMIRHGYFGCVTCHADPSGGSLLTPYGRAQGDLLLRMRYGAATTTEAGSSADDFDDFDDFDASGSGAKTPARPAPEAEEPGRTGPLWGWFESPDWLLVGGSYRHMNLYKVGRSDPFRTFPMQVDLLGEARLDVFRISGSLGVAKVPAGSPFTRRAQVTSNQGDELNLISRTHWVGADLANRSVTLRAGRLDLPFGVRIPEHTMWVREATRTDRESAQQHGLAVAYNGGFLRGEVMGIAGNYQIHPSAMRERGYSAFAEVRVTEWAYAGVSSLATRADTDFQTLKDDVTRQAHGGFARLAPVEAVVVLVEGDALLKTHRDFGYVGFAQVDVEPLQGLHFLATGEVLDAGFEDTGDPFNTIRVERGFGRPRFGGWLGVDWFFLPQLETRFDVVARQDDPLTLLMQLHVYL